MPDEYKCDDSYEDDFASSASYSTRLESICEDGRGPRPSLQRSLGRRSLVEPAPKDDEYSLDSDFASHRGKLGLHTESSTPSPDDSSDDDSYSVDDFASVQTKQSVTAAASRNEQQSSPVRPPPEPTPDCDESADDTYSVDDFASVQTPQLSRIEAASVNSVAQQPHSEETKDDFDDDVGEEGSSTPSLLNTAPQTYVSGEECKEDVEMGGAQSSAESCSVSDEPMLDVPDSSPQDSCTSDGEECKLEAETMGGIAESTASVSSDDGPEAGPQPQGAESDTEAPQPCSRDGYATQQAPIANDHELQSQVVLEAPAHIEKGTPTSSNEVSPTSSDEYEYIGLVEQTICLPRQNAQTQTHLEARPAQRNPPTPTPKRVPASFVPRCAYAKTRKQRSAIEVQEEKPAKVRRYSKRRLEQLAKPVAHHLHGGKENNLPESMSKVGTASKKKQFDDEDAEDFLDRMEAKETERQEKLARAAAEAQYDARTDKKRCSSCGAVQSYDEMVGDSNMCRTDACRKAKRSYQPPKRFVLKEFEERQQRSSQRRSSVVDRIHEERRSSIISTSQRRSRRQKELLEKVSTEDFNSRMAKDIEARKTKIQHIQTQRMDLLSKDYTFKPKLNVPEHLIRNRKGGWDSLSAPLRRYTEEYQPPPSRRGTKKKKSRRKPLESPWGSSNAQSKRKVDEERMKSKFQRMIM